MSNDDDQKSSVSFDIVSYWIQGRVGDDWQNLESQEKGRDASARFTALRDGGQYEELRLIEATLSAFTKETFYRTVAHYISEDSLARGYEPVSDEDLYTQADSEEPAIDTERMAVAQAKPAGAAFAQPSSDGPASGVEAQENPGQSTSPWPAGEKIDHPLENPEGESQPSVFAEPEQDETPQEQTGATAEELPKLPEFLENPQQNSYSGKPRKRRFLWLFAVIVIAATLAGLWLQVSVEERQAIRDRLLEEAEQLVAPIMEMIRREPPQPEASAEGSAPVTAKTVEPVPKAPVIVYVPPVEEDEDNGYDVAPASKPEEAIVKTPPEDTINLPDKSEEPPQAETIPETPIPSPPQEPEPEQLPTPKAEAASEPEAPAARLSYFSTGLAEAIDGQNPNRLKELLQNWPDDLPLDKAGFQTVDKWGAGDRPVMDHALLNGRWEEARLLAEYGLQPSAYLVHAAFAGETGEPYPSVADFLLAEGLGLNREWRGKTPLILAFERRDRTLLRHLINQGADPALSAVGGQSLIEQLRRSGDNDWLAEAILGQQGKAYEALMLGLDWRKGLADVKQQLGACRPFDGHMTACRLNADLPYPSAGQAIAQFDDGLSGKLVAIQVDSQRFDSEEGAMAAFDKVIKAIEASLPADHVGFTSHSDRDAASVQMPMFSGDGGYFAYWSDQDRRRPVFIHASLNSLDSNSGYYRILIGNPFHRQ